MSRTRPPVFSNPARQDAVLHKIRGRIHLYSLGLRFRWAYVGAVVSAVYAVIAIALQPSDGGAGFVVAVVFVALAIVILIRDTRTIRQDTSDLYLVDLDADQLRELDLTDTYADYKVEDFRQLRAIYSREVNRLLPVSSPRSELTGGFDLPRAVKAMQPFLLGQAFRSRAVLFNSPKVRMVTDLTPAGLEDGEPVRLEKTDYFAGLCTNELALKEVRSKQTGARRLAGFELFANNRQLLDLAQSQCSNHVGIATLAFTADGQMIVTVQASSSAQSPSLIAPSGSGSADHDDLQGRSDDFLAFIARAMERELAEECGLDARRLPHMETRVIGFARFLMRGGKPEFFGVTHLDVAAAELAIPGKESVFIADLMATRVHRHQQDKLIENLRDFRESHERSFSLPLHLHLRFLEDYVSAYPDDFASLVLGPTPVRT